MVSLLLLLSIVGYVMARGPHHPRGASITKQHVHYRPTRGITSDKLTSDSELLHDTEHIQEDLGTWMGDKDIEAMTDEELEFHYFQLHDFDKNNRLDGLEILQAIHHTENHEIDEDHVEESYAQKLQSEENFSYYVELIDKVLLEDDIDLDGYLSYPEYAAGRKRAKDIEEKNKDIEQGNEIEKQNNEKEDNNV